MSGIQPAQVYFKEQSTVEVLQALLVLLGLATFLFTWGVWIVKESGIRMAVAFSLLWLVKTAVDCSLMVHVPPQIVLGSLASLLRKSLFKQMFVSNLDPWIGCSILAFMFAFSIENRRLRIAQAVLSSVAFVFSFFVLAIYQLCYSYSIYSAMIGAVFAFVFSHDVDRFFQNWNDQHDRTNPPPALVIKGSSESANHLNPPNFEQTEVSSYQDDVSIDNRQSDNL